MRVSEDWAPVSEIVPLRMIWLDVTTAWPEPTSRVLIRTKVLEPSPVEVMSREATIVVRSRAMLPETLLIVSAPAVTLPEALTAAALTIESGARARLTLLLKVSVAFVPIVRESGR